MSSVVVLYVQIPASRYAIDVICAGPHRRFAYILSYRIDDCFRLDDHILSFVSRESPLLFPLVTFHRCPSSIGTTVYSAVVLYRALVVRNVREWPATARQYRLPSRHVHFCSSDAMSNPPLV